MMTEFITEELEEQRKDSPMWEYLKKEEYDYVQPERGDIREGTVLSKRPDEILIDVGLKLEAIVPRRDLEKLDPEVLENIKEGDVVHVFVLQPENQEGRLVASLNMARTLQDWQKAQEMMESGELHEAVVSNYNKGGVIVPFYGLRGFVPASQLVKLPPAPEGGSRLDRLGELVGKTLKLKIIEVSRRRRRLIMSERAAMREWRKEQKERLLQSLKPGDVVHGTVTNLMNFGAFVDLGGADGLVHVSEIAWQRVRHPRDVLNVGQEVDVYVLSVDKESERIALSIKKLQPEPWSLLGQNRSVGDLVEGEITNVTEFGAFARLAEGVEGLIHVSELAEGPIEDPRKVVKRGQRLQLRIIRMDIERRRVGLSLKRALPEEEEEGVEKAVAEEVAEAAAEEAPVEEVTEPAVEEAVGEEAVSAEATAEEAVEAVGEEAIVEELTEAASVEAVAEEATEATAEEAVAEEPAGPAAEEAVAEEVAEATTGEAVAEELVEAAAEEAVAEEVAEATTEEAVAEEAVETAAEEPATEEAVEAAAEEPVAEEAVEAAAEEPATEGVAEVTEEGAVAEEVLPLSSEEEPVVVSTLPPDPPEMDEHEWQGLMEEAPPQAAEPDDIPVPAEASDAA